MKKTIQLFTLTLIIALSCLVIQQYATVAFASILPSPAGDEIIPLGEKDKENDGVIEWLEKKKENDGVIEWLEKKKENDGVIEWLEKKKRSEEHTSELQSRPHLVCRLLLEKKKKKR